MPESDDAIVQADAKLAEAMSYLAAGFERGAIREAYMAGLQAARAILFEMLRVATKSHKSTRISYTKLAHERPDLALPRIDFLQIGFDAKQDMDYGAGDSVKISAVEAVASARDISKPPNGLQKCKKKRRR